jgi:hypothetical protein
LSKAIYGSQLALTGTTHIESNLRDVIPKFCVPGRLPLLSYLLLFIGCLIRDLDRLPPISRVRAVQSVDEPSEALGRVASKVACW